MNGSQAQTNATKFVEFNCCALLQTLTDYMVQSTGDKVQEKNTEMCCDLKLIQLFKLHTNSMLQIDSGERNDEKSFTEHKTKIMISKAALENAYEDLLVLAFLGRAVANDNDMEDISLEYEHSTEKLSIRDSACATDKTIYTTIVVASISLLIFFIASQVVTEESKKQAPKSTQSKLSLFAQPQAIDLKNSCVMRGFGY
jgi:hypothetical protein